MERGIGKRNRHQMQCNHPVQPSNHMCIMYVPYPKWTRYCMNLPVWRMRDADAFCPSACMAEWRRRHACYYQRWRLHTDGGEQNRGELRASIRRKVKVKAKAKAKARTRTTKTMRRTQAGRRCREDRTRMTCRIQYSVYLWFNTEYSVSESV